MICEISNCQKRVCKSVVVRDLNLLWRKSECSIKTRLITAQGPVISRAKTFDSNAY